MALSDLESHDGFPRLYERYLAVFSTTSNADDRAVKARIFAEALCRRLHVQEIGEEPNQSMTLEPYLKTFKNHNLPLSYIYPLIENIQKRGNYAGHDQPGVEPITPNYVESVFTDVDFLMNWYSRSTVKRVK